MKKWCGQDLILALTFLKAVATSSSDVQWAVEDEKNCLSLLGFSDWRPEN